eukprot:6762775-Prymnesium_polylepis.1
MVATVREVHEISPAGDRCAVVWARESQTVLPRRPRSAPTGQHDVLLNSVNVQVIGLFGGLWPMVRRKRRCRALRGSAVPLAHEVRVVERSNR